MPRVAGVGGSALIVALVAADALLVGAALRHPHPTSASATEEVTTTLPPQLTPPTPAIATVPGAARTSSRMVPAADPGADRLFSAADGTIAWRATGGCTSKPALQATHDGGASWTPVNSPAPHLLRVVLTSGTAAWVVGADQTCSPSYYSTSDGGATWSAPTALGQVWVPTANGVRTPGGTTATPCGTAAAAPVALAPAGNSGAVVICATGVFRTADAGTSWQPVGKLPAGAPAAVAMTAAGSGVLLLDGAPKCAGLRVATTGDTGKTWTKGGCLTDALSPASVSVTSTGTGLLVSAGRAYATADGGKTWT